MVLMVFVEVAALSLAHATGASYVSGNCCSRVPVHRAPEPWQRLSARLVNVLTKSFPDIARALEEPTGARAALEEPTGARA